MKHLAVLLKVLAFRCSALLAAYLFLAYFSFGVFGEKYFARIFFAAFSIAFFFSLASFLKDAVDLFDARKFCSKAVKSGFLVNYLEPAAGLMAEKNEVDNPFFRRHMAVSAALSAKERPPVLPAPANIGIRLAAAFLALAAALALAGAETPRFFAFPFIRENISDYLIVEPGTAKIREGENLEITVSKKRPVRADPFLEIGGRGRNWIRVPWDREAGSFSYLMENINESAAYRVSLPGVKSKVFNIAVEKPPQLSLLKIMVEHPAYLGRKAAGYGSIPAVLSVPEGSLLKFRAKTGETSDLVYFLSGESGKKAFRAEGGSLEFSFTAFKTLSYEVRAAKEGGIEKTVFRGKIEAVADKKPEARILSPVMDVNMDAGDSLGIIYEAEDDWGVEEIVISKKHVRENGDVRETTEKIMAFRKKNVRETGGRYLLFAPADLRRGEIRARVGASDFYPGKGRVSFSEEVKITVRDRVSDHLAVKEDLKSLIKKVERLSRLQQKTVSDMRTGAANLEKLAGEWKKIAASAGRLAQKARKDPYFNRGQAGEIRETQGNLEYGVGFLMSDMMKKFSAGDWPGAAKRAAGMKNVLEFASARLKKILETQNLKDMELSPLKWEKRIKNILEVLSGESSAPAGDLGRVMEQLAGELEELKNFLEDLKKGETGEDAKIFSLPAGRMSGLAAGMRKAFESGDAQKSLEYAKKLLEEIRKTKRVLREFFEYAMERRGNLFEDFGDIEKKWERLRGRQEEEVKKNARFAERLTLEKDGFIRENTALAMAGLNEMKKINGKFESAGIEKSLNSGEFGEAARMFSAEAAGDFIPAEPDAGRAFADRAESVASALKKLAEPGGFLSESDRERFKKARRNQSLIISSSEILANEIEEAGSMNPLFAARLAEKLGRAAGEMKASLPFLDSFNINGALVHQINALKELEDGKKALNEEENRRKRISDSISRSPSLPRSGAESAGGFDEGRVKLPEPGSWAPPKNIREEVMKSLKEKMPDDKRGEIIEYLREISK